MAATPSPPLLTTGTTTPTTTFYNNGAAASSSNIISPPSSSSSSSTSISTSIIIVIIVIASAIIVSASIYLMLRFFSRRCSSRSAVRSISFSSSEENMSDNANIGSQPTDQDHHVICFDNNNNSKIQSLLPMFTFSSLTGNIAGGDCAVCLSKFESMDQLRLLPLCCHAFHTECIDAWLKSNQTCPLCRSSVNPTDADVFKKIRSVSVSRGNRNGNNGHYGNTENDGYVSNNNHDNNNNNSNNNSFRIEIGSVSQRRTPSDSGRRSYNIGSYEYVLEQNFHEIPIESIHQRETSGDKDLITPDQPGENLAAEIGESGRRNWLQDYVNRMSVSISSRSQSFRSSGRFFTGSSRRSEMVDDFEANHSRVGEEISELFRWLSGV